MESFGLRPTQSSAPTIQAPAGGGVEGAGPIDIGVTAPVVEFDPSLIFQGIDQASELTNQAIDFATNQFGIAATYQNPFFNNAQGFNQLSQNALAGQFNPQNDAFAFTAGPGNPEYDFRLQQGIDAIDASASGRGLLNSGTRFEDLNILGQGLSSTFSTQDLQNRLAASNNSFNNLNTVAGYEQAGANNISNINTGLGQLGASAYSGLGSNILGALSGAAQLQNQTALSNAGFDLTAQGQNQNAILGLINSANQQGSGGSGTSTTGQLIGAGLTLLPYLL